MSIKGSLNDNAECIDHTLASATAITMTDVFSKAVNTVEIDSDVDTTLTVLFGGAPPAAAGNSTAAVAGWSKKVGPSFGPAIFHTVSGSRTLGVKNTGAVSAALSINGWQGIRLRN